MGSESVRVSVRFFVPVLVRVGNRVLFSVTLGLGFELGLNFMLRLLLMLGFGLVVELVVVFFSARVIEYYTQCNALTAPWKCTQLHVH